MEYTEQNLIGLGLSEIIPDGTCIQAIKGAEISFFKNHELQVVNKILIKFPKWKKEYNVNIPYNTNDDHPCKMVPLEILHDALMFGANIENDEIFYRLGFIKI